MGGWVGRSSLSVNLLIAVSAYRHVHASVDDYTIFVTVSSKEHSVIPPVVALLQFHGQQQHHR